MPRLGPYGPLPTIAKNKAQGCVSVIVYCRGLHCSGCAEIAFDTLRLPDDTAIIDIGKAKRFVCKRCGCRDVEVRSNWPDPRELTRRKSGE